MAVLEPKPPSAEPISVTERFHRVNRLLPEGQTVLHITPDTKAKDALALMQKHGYSQIPVVLMNEVLGIFSLRSFAGGVIDMASEKTHPADLGVEEFIEKPPFARVTDDLRSLFNDLDEHNAVLIGDPERLQGIATPMDVLRYFYNVTSPFLLLAEIELAIRDLIKGSVSTTELYASAQQSLSQIYTAESLPRTLEDMTFNDYVQIIGDGRNWPRFALTLGGTRERTRTKLSEVRDLRNDVFHFKRELTPDDLETLRAHRGWLLIRARATEARRRGGER